MHIFPKRIVQDLNVINFATDTILLLKIFKMFSNQVQYTVPKLI